MLHITTAQWIAYLAPAVIVQAVGILAAVKVGRGGPQVAVETQTTSEPVFEEAA